MWELFIWLLQVRRRHTFSARIILTSIINAAVVVVKTLNFSFTKRLIVFPFFVFDDLTPGLFSIFTEPEFYNGLIELKKTSLNIEQRVWVSLSGE